MRAGVCVSACVYSRRRNTTRGQMVAAAAARGRERSRGVWTYYTQLEAKVERDFRDFFLLLDERKKNTRPGVVVFSRPRRADVAAECRIELGQVVAVLDNEIQPLFLNILPSSVVYPAESI